MERLDKETEVSCSLNDVEFRQRRAMARRTLIPHAQACKRHENGVRIAFGPSKGLQKLVEEFVKLERQCCGFLTFEITDGTCGHSKVLSISGPPEASATIDMFANAVDAATD